MSMNMGNVVYWHKDQVVIRLKSQPAHSSSEVNTITTVIFTTGFRADLSWLRVPGAVDDRGAPIQDEGRARIDGLWFLGWAWLRHRKSGIIWGAAEDTRRDQWVMP